MQLKVVPPLTAATTKALAGYRWPGNVRELKNVLERALILSDGKQLEVKLPSGLDASPGPPPLAAGDFAGRTLRDVTDEITRAMCLGALEQCNGNKKQAAKMLGIARDSFLPLSEAIWGRCHQRGLKVRSVSRNVKAESG